MPCIVVASATADSDSKRSMLICILERSYRTPHFLLPMTCLSGSPDLTPSVIGRSRRLAWTATFAVALSVVSGCSILPRPRTSGTIATREFSTTVLLHGKALELHLAAPQTPSAAHVVVLYASGDGGWFGTAVDMFRQIGKAGYFAAGFSSRAFLKIERPRGTLVNATQLAAEYEQILAQARSAMGLDATNRTVLTGWSRGAAFSVLVASEPAPQDPVLGVIAIGLAEGEDLKISGADDETDDGGRTSIERRQWPFDTYALIARLGPVPCAVIQATHDNYLPATRARELFGPDTPLRRFYAVNAKNHRFSDGKPAFDAAFLEAIRWVASYGRSTQ